MPPKKKVNSEQLVEAAFDIAAASGLESVTIRAVAKKLGCSIAPIYVNFPNVAALKQRVLQKFKAAKEKMMERYDSGDEFLNIGLASLDFARTYPVIFRELLLDGHKPLDDQNDDMDDIIAEKMRLDESLNQLPDEDLHELILRVRIFQAGLALMACNSGYADRLTPETAAKMLKQTGDDIRQGMLQRQDTKETSYE